MTAIHQDFKVYRGNTYSISVALTQADGTPFDPSIASDIQWRMARTWHSTDIDSLVLKKLNAGIVTVPSGVTITLAPEDTDFPPAFYYHELKVFESADVATVMVGTAIVKKAIPMGAFVQAAAAHLSLAGKVPTRNP